MLAGLPGGNNRRFQVRFVIAASLLSLAILAVEIVLFHAFITPWVLVPVAVGICLRDRYFEVPLVGGPLYYYHIVVLATFIVISPSNAVFAAVLLMLARAAKHLNRSAPQIILRVARFLPTLFSVWIVAGIYTWGVAEVSLGKWGNLFPVLCLIMSYYLSHTFLGIAVLKFIRPIDLFRLWKSRHLTPCLLLLSLVTTVALIQYFAFTFGNVIYILIIPLVGFTVVAYRIHVHRIKASSQRLTAKSEMQMSVIEILALAIDAKHSRLLGM